MNRFTRLVVGLTLLTGACSSTSEAETLPTLELTTTTTEPTTTEAPTTTVAPSRTTSTEATTTSSVAAKQFDPETAQAEIAGLVERMDRFWTGPARTVDPADPEVTMIYSGGQLERVQASLAKWMEAGQLIEGESVIVLDFGPAILLPLTQSADIFGCSLDAVSLLNADGLVSLAPDTQPLEYGLEFTYTPEGWRISNAGTTKSVDGEQVPCEL